MVVPVKEMAFPAMAEVLLLAPRLRAVPVVMVILASAVLVVVVALITGLLETAVLVALRRAMLVRRERELTVAVVAVVLGGALGAPVQSALRAGMCASGPPGIRTPMPAGTAGRCLPCLRARNRTGLPTRAWLPRFAKGTGAWKGPGATRFHPGPALTRAILLTPGAPRHP